MKIRKKLVLSVHVPLAVFWVALAMIVFPYSPAKTIEAGGSGCEGDIKIDLGGPGTIEAPPGMTITSICIKAGRNTKTFAQHELGDGCYSLVWSFDRFGCAISVDYSGGGTGRDCKSISHVAAMLESAECKVHL